MPEFRNPTADGLVDDDNSACRHQVFDLEKAQREPEICPDGVGDNFSRETMAFEGTRLLGFYHARKYQCVRKSAT